MTALPDDAGKRKPMCERKGWLFRGCNFVARFDEVPLADSMRFDKLQATSDQIRAATMRRVYVRDVCTSCGRTIERVRPSPPAAKAE